MNECIGSDFDDFLKEEGMFEEVEAAAIKKVIACMIEQEMRKQQLSKTAMAKHIHTSRSQLDRILDPNNHAITLETIIKAAKSVGKKITINFEDDVLRSPI